MAKKLKQLIYKSEASELEIQADGTDAVYGLYIKTSPSGVNIEPEDVRQLVFSINRLVEDFELMDVKSRFEFKEE